MTKEEAFKNLVALNAVCGQKDFFDKEFEEALLVAEKALEQEPCPYWDYGLNTCRHANIGALATVTHISSKGEWETGYTFPDGEYWKCSECGELIKVKFPMNFCNSCGADMRVSEDM